MTEKKRDSDRERETDKQPSQTFHPYIETEQRHILNLFERERDSDRERETVTEKERQ